MDLGLKNVVVEGDSLAVTQALNGMVTPAISIQKVSEGILSLQKKCLLATKNF